MHISTKKLTEKGERRELGEESIDRSMVLDITEKSRGVCTPPDLYSDHLFLQNKRAKRKKKKKAEKEKERDRTILITGASSGIGLSLSRKLLRSGFHVIAACKDSSEVVPLAQDLRSSLLHHQSSSGKGVSYHEAEASENDKEERGGGGSRKERDEEEEESDDRDDEEEKNRRHIAKTRKELKHVIPRRGEEVKKRKKKVRSESAPEEAEEHDQAQRLIQETEDQSKVKEDRKVKEKESCGLQVCSEKQQKDRKTFSSKAERDDKRMHFSRRFRMASASSSSSPCFSLSFECMYSRCLVMNMDVTSSDQVQEAARLTRLFLARAARKRKGEKKREKKRMNEGLYAVIHCAGIWICDFAPSSCSSDKPSLVRNFSLLCMHSSF